MKNRTRHTLRLIGFRSTIGLLFLLLALASTESPVWADGKLRRASQAIRKHQPVKPSQSKSKPKRERDEGDDKRDDRRETSRPSRRNNSRGHRHRRPRNSSGLVFISSHRTCPPPVIVPQVCHPIVPPPIVVEQPAQAPYPVYEPTVDITAPIESGPVTELQPPVVEEVIIEEISEVEFGGDWFHTDASRLWAAIGTDFDGITEGGLGLHLQDAGGLGLETSVMTLRESTSVYRDHLWIGDVNLVYELLARGDVRGRIGVGVNWLSDAWGGAAGFNLTAGLDFRLTDRVLLAMEGDLGSLGDADFFHGRINLARRFDRCELMLGMDHYDIGGGGITSLFTGLQLRF